MQQAILFKIIQRRNRYRNPNHLLRIPSDLIYTDSEYQQARDYIQKLISHNISFTYPQHTHYPRAFYKMKEPPLFLEYQGDEIWNRSPLISVVGSREINDLSKEWMNLNLPAFLKKNSTLIGIVSGGAYGVDQLAHRIAIRAGHPTIFVLPSGLLSLYPKNLIDFDEVLAEKNHCFMSEFEMHQRPHKSHFYFRNRLISALGEMTLVVQASLRSGSLLTVHHCLEIGRPVLTLPSHPNLNGFAGNIKLLQDGAFLINDFHDLLEIWKAESWAN